MTVAVVELSAVQQDAERRLGRPLTLAERRIDIAGIDRDLAAGKQALYTAIDKEKRRAINAHLRYGRHMRLDVTDAMRTAIRNLYRAGRKHGRAEVEQATGQPLPRGFSEKDAIDKMEARLRRELKRLQTKAEHRVGEAVGADLEIGDIAASAATRAVLQMPGALNVASQIVSGSMFAGIGDVLSSAAGLFDSWEYSAVMDDNTCDPCAELDGTVYESWEAIQEVLPDGGPNPECDGEGRCRCRAVPGDVSAPPGIEASAPLEPGMPDWWTYLPEHARQGVETLTAEETASQLDRLKKYVRPLRQHAKAGTRNVHPEKIPALERRISELETRLKELGGPPKRPRVPRAPKPAPAPTPAPVAPARTIDTTTSLQTLLVQGQKLAGAPRALAPEEQAFGDAARDYLKQRDRVERALARFGQYASSGRYTDESPIWWNVMPRRLPLRAGETPRSRAQRWLSEQDAKLEPMEQKLRKAAAAAEGVEAPAVTGIPSRMMFTSFPSAPKTLSDAKSIVRRDVNTGADLMDRVFSFDEKVLREPSGRMELSIKTEGGRKQRAYGTFYQSFSRSGKPRININPATTTGYGTSPLETFLHEFGHYLDKELGANAGSVGYASDIAAGRVGAARQADPGLIRVMDAIRQTRAYEKLQEANRAARGSSWLSESHAAYLSSDIELFARSFSQYATRKMRQLQLNEIERSGVERADAMVQRRAGDEYGTHWHDADFDRVYDAYDRWFSELGWLR